MSDYKCDYCGKDVESPHRFCSEECIQKYIDENMNGDQFLKRYPRVIDFRLEYKEPSDSMRRCHTCKNFRRYVVVNENAMPGIDCQYERDLTDISDCTHYERR